MNLSSLAARAEEFWIPVESNPFYGNGGGGGGLVYARLSALVKLFFPPSPILILRSSWSSLTPPRLRTRMSRNSTLESSGLC